ncbi:hypothetical protein [Halobellus litoreus]|uniref:Uncharacterized protein n=1 Tax=Halobellus litoreus TaxID=755310 RepID=A0ABD6DVR6_9EURY|nr:hypothetical protein [Halobellus litoreus]
MNAIVKILGNASAVVGAGIFGVNNVLRLDLLAGVDDTGLATLGLVGMAGTAAAAYGIYEAANEL